MSAESKVNKKYKLVAPDGGWGYMICLSFIVINATTTMFMGCFGLLYNDFMVQIDIASTGVTLLYGFNAISFSLSGFFVSSLVKLLSLRKTAFLGAMLNIVGTVGMIFCNSYVTFVICQGILPGIALGLSYSSSCGIMNEYYVKKRMFAYSIVQFGVAAITMLAPMLVKLSLEQYGFRGTLLLIAGISFNNVFGVLLMQPVEWHMKRVEVPITPDIQPLLNKEMDKDKSKMTETTIETGATSEKYQVSDIEGNSSNNIRAHVEKLLDIRFFLKFIRSCVCIGPALASFVEMTFIILLPQALYSTGWNQGMVAMALFMYCFGDMAMRVALIFTSKWILKLGSQEAYIIGLVLATFGKLGMIWSEEEIPIYVYLVLIGIARCFIFVILTEVIADNVPPENFTQAIGTYIMATGAITIIIGPAIGVTRDLTNSYSTAFYLLTSFFAIIILFWTIEIVYKKNKGKRIIQRQTADKSKQLNK